MKIKHILLFAVLLLLKQSIFSQNNLYREIQSIQASNAIFQKISTEWSNEKNERIVERFKDKDAVDFFKYVPLNLENFTKALSLQIPVSRKENYILLLTEVESNPSYKVTTDKGATYVPNKNIKHYRGIVQNDPNSLVAISFFENEIMGVVSTSEGNFNIVFDKTSGSHVFYNDNNLIERTSFECSLIDNENTSYNPDVLHGNYNNMIMGSATYSLKYVRLYFETEFDIYQTRNSSITNVEAFVTGLYNQIATLYRNEDIFTQLSEIHIWTTEDPYTENNTADLLTKFQNTRTSINGDLGQLITFRSVGGGRAVVNGLCNSKTKNKLGVCGIDNFFNIVPNYSWSVFSITHEFGHLLGSQHTHKCVWNGNNTAIDGCGTIEGSCTRPPAPSAGGTIMSYCHNNPVRINFSLGFGPQPGNVIRNTVNSANCLNTHTIVFTGDTEVCDVGNHTYTLNGLPSDIPIVWSSSNNSMTLVSTTGNSAVFRRMGFGNCEIRATISPFRTLILPVSICQPSISGPSAICDQATYTINNFPPGATVQWSVSNNKVLLQSGQGMSTAIFAKNGNGLSGIQARISISGQTITLQRDVWAGVPDRPDIDDCDNQTCNTLCYFSFFDERNNRYFYSDPRSNIIQWEWVKEGSNFDWGITDNMINFKPKVKNSVVPFKGRVKNACGWSEWNYFSLGVISCDEGVSILRVSPNPATSSVTINLQENTETEGIQSYSMLSRSNVTNSVSYQIQLWNSFGLVKSVTTDQSEYQLDLSDVAPGFYYVHVIKDGQTYRQQLVVK